MFLKRIDIAGVKISNRYKDISNKLGYDVDEYFEDLLDLITIWNKQKYIEVYENKLERTYGRVKDSNSKPGSTPWYIDLYHARVVMNDNDPLVVLEFEEPKKNGDLPILVVKFLIHHDEMFGSCAEKHNRQLMQAIRRRIDAYRREGNE